MIFTFIPKPTDDKQFAFQQRVIARGISLVKDGYTLVHRNEIPGTYYVHSPEGKVYIVDVRGKFTFDLCQCGCYEKNGYCKHLVACTLAEKEFEEARDEARVAEYEATGR
jgi:uncharacterized Zn finger protein